MRVSPQTLPLAIRVPTSIATALLIVPSASCSSRSGSPFASSGEDAAADAGTDSALAHDSPDNVDSTGSTFDAQLEATGPTAQMRIANWSPDAPGSGYDVCLALHGTSTWVGPLLAQQIGDAGVLGDAAVASIQFPSVTNYLLQVAPAAYDLAVVRVGAGCASPVATATDLPALQASSWYTVAIVGDASPAGADPALSVVVLADDTSAAIGAAVRFLDVAPSIRSADFGEGTLGPSFVPLAVDVPFAGLATMAIADAGPTPDTNGYVGVPQLNGAPLSAHAAMGATGDAAVAPNQTLTAGTVVTVALVGGKTGGAKAQLVVCTGDGVTNESSGLYSACAVASM